MRQGNVIETSDIHDNADAGIQNQSGENTVIRNNEITDNTNNGISLEGEDERTGGRQHAVR